MIYGTFFWFSDGVITNLRVIANFLLVILIGVALIWFPDELGSFTGYLGARERIDMETPPIFLTILGWSLLLGTGLILYHLRSISH